MRKKVKGNKFIGISFKVVGVISIIIFFSLLILSFLVNQYMKRELNIFLKLRNKELADLTEAKTEGFLNEVERIINFTANRKSIRAGSRTAILDFLGELKENYTFFEYVFFIDNQGNILVSPYISYPVDFDTIEGNWRESVSHNEELTWSSIYYNEDNSPGITISRPVYDYKNQIIGILGAVVNFSEIEQLVISSNIGITGTAFMTDSKANIIVHSLSDYTTDNYKFRDLIDFLDDITLETILSQKEGSIEYSINGETKLASFTKEERIDGIIFTQFPAEEVYFSGDAVTNYFTIGGIVCLFILILSLFFIIRIIILKPLHKIRKAMQNVSRGSLKQNIFSKDCDELGILANSFNIMTSNLKEIIVKINKTIEEVTAALSYMQNASNEVAYVSQVVTETIGQVASGAEQQSENVEKINAEIVTLDNYLKEVVSTNTMVEKMAMVMNNATKDGCNKMDNVIGQMDKIKDSINAVEQSIDNLDNIIKEINSILEIINNISEQTNLLALNATIEAARAGEAGRGFTVVADEIRELAEDSSSSTKHIRDLIKKIKEETNQSIQMMSQGNVEIENGLLVVDLASESFNNMKNGLDKLITGIKESTNLIGRTSRNSEMIVENVQNIAGVSQQTTSSVEEVAATSKELNYYMEGIIDCTVKLSKVVDELDKIINKFEC